MAVKKRRTTQQLERLNATLEQRVEARTRCIKLMQDVAVIANEAGSVEQALARTLERICQYLGWPVGHVHLPDRANPASFVDSGIWWLAAPDRFESFVEAHKGLAFRSGQGMPGRVLETGRFHWSPDLMEDEVFLRRSEAGDAGLKAALCLPVLAGRRVVALLEFFAVEFSQPDEPLVDALAEIGIQLGRVIERTELERQIVQKTVDEQQRIGQELHDSVAQQCTGMAMLAETLRQLLAAENSPHTERAARLVEEIRAAHEQVRRLSHGLMPVEVHSGGLVPALDRLAKVTREVSGVDCRFEREGPLLIQDSATATHLYRIAQEAVQNAVRHGEARHVAIRLEKTPEQISLLIRDDGRGMPTGMADPASAGLRIMRYRAGLVGGLLNIESREGRGVVVNCVIPKRD